MADFEPTAFLRELDSFGRPPPPQKLITEEGHSPLVTRDIAAKLNALNIQKQKKISPPKIPVSNGMARLGERRERVTPISQDEIKQWKNSVLSENRPRNQWAESQRVSPNESRIRAKELQSEVDRYDSPFESPRGTELRLVTPDADSALSTSSNSPQSRQLSSAAASSPQSSTSSTTENRLPPGYRYSPTIASLNATSPEAKDYGIRMVDVTPQGYGSRVNGPDTNGKGCGTSASPDNQSFGYASETSPGTSSERGNRTTPKNVQDNGVTKKFLRNGENVPIEHRPSVLQQLRAENQLKTSAERGDELVKKNAKWTRITSALEDQQAKYEQLTAKLQKEMEEQRAGKNLGKCDRCAGPLNNAETIIEAFASKYHHRCFTCDACGRPLKDKKFFRLGDRLLCDEDYRYQGVLETAEKCSTCSHPITDMVLQTLGKSYHPKCFRCCVCNSCLDGLPFAVDTAQQVYCLDDYHKLFAPKCTACKKAVMPDMKTGETIRVVALGNDYHVECYVCEGCGTQLTDEPEKRCYPINSHLLCQECHVHWARTGGDKRPITDL